MDPIYSLLGKHNTVFQATRKTYLFLFFLKILMNLLGTQDFSVANPVVRSGEVSHVYIVKVL